MDGSRTVGCASWLESAEPPAGTLCLPTISESTALGQSPWEWAPEGRPSPLSPSVPGPCDHEDLLDGVIFGARYLGSTQLVSERNPPTSTRMAQAREAMDRVKVRGRPGAGGQAGGLRAGSVGASTSHATPTGPRRGDPAHDGGGPVRLHQEDQGLDIGLPGTGQGPGPRDAGGVIEPGKAPQPTQAASPAPRRP